MKWSRVLIIIKHVELLTKENENVHDRWCYDAKKNYLNSHIHCMPYNIKIFLFLVRTIHIHIHTHTLYTRKDKTSKHQYYNCYVYWNVIKVVKANFLMEISNGTSYIYVLDMNDLYLCVHILDEILLLLLLYCYSTQVNPYTQPFIWEKFYCISNSKCTYDDDDDDAASTRHNTF